MVPSQRRQLNLAQGLARDRRAIQREVIMQFLILFNAPPHVREAGVNIEPIRLDMAHLSFV
jgi:hypothetical protein